MTTYHAIFCEIICVKLYKLFFVLSSTQLPVLANFVSRQIYTKKNTDFTRKSLLEKCHAFNLACSICLYVRTRVSLICPQEVPVRALGMLRRGDARETCDDMWGEKVNLGSKLTTGWEGSQLGGGERS